MRHLAQFAAVSALMLAAAGCSSGPKGDGNQTEIDAAAKTLDKQVGASVDRKVAEIEAERVPQNPDGLNNQF